MQDTGLNDVYVLAPNYQAGKDLIAGFKRYYKGEIVDEIYTPLNQPDFSAELAQVARARTRTRSSCSTRAASASTSSASTSRPACAGQIPLYSVSTVDELTLPALKDDALGAARGAFWGPDLNNPVNQKFVDDFEKKYNRMPVVVRRAVLRRHLLLDSAMREVKGNVADKKAHGRPRCARRTSSRSRGNFKFNNNHFPIQDFYLLEVVKDAQGPRSGHGDPEDGVQEPQGRVLAKTAR